MEFSSKLKIHIMTKVKLYRELESITFEKNHSEGDEWRSLHQPSNAGSTDWTTKEVENKVADLESKGWKKS